MRYAICDISIVTLWDLSLAYFVLRGDKLGRFSVGDV